MPISSIATWFEHLSRTFKYFVFVGGLKAPSFVPQGQVKVSECASAGRKDENYAFLSLGAHLKPLEANTES